MILMSHNPHGPTRLLPCPSIQRGDHRLVFVCLSAFLSVCRHFYYTGRFKRREYSYRLVSGVCYLFIRPGFSRAESLPITMCPVSVIRLGSYRAESFPITMCSVLVVYLLDSALPEPSLSLSLCVRCLLVVYLFIYLRV